MPEKTKTYERVIFTPEAIKQAEHELVATLSSKDRKQTGKILDIQLSPGEAWEHDNEEEFFADYIKGVEEATYRKFYNWGVGEILFRTGDNNTRVSVKMPDRTGLEKVFNVIESFVEQCRLPKEPTKDTQIKTDWIIENINRIDSYHPVTGRKLKLALNKLESEDTEEWQNAAMLIRDAWIELSQHLCFVNQINTLDVGKDAVVERLRKLGIEKGDVKLFNLARDTFNLSNKHHSRELDQYSAVACVISSIVSMQTIIQEALNATG